MKFPPLGSFVNNQWLSSSTSFPVNNPANLENIADVSCATDAQTVNAIESAKNAFQSWSKLPAAKRSEYLMNWYHEIIKAKARLAKILTIEQGKPLAEAEGEVVYGASFIKWFAEEALRISGDIIPSLSSDKRIMVIKQPVGVVTAITPWNFPNAMITRKAAAALAAGCTFVVKPSELTPLSALALAELAEKVGLPAGVFNVVVGDNAAEIGKVLTTHADVAKFSFTGSTPVGKLLLAQCASTVKRTSMELGGNAPFIVFGDADIDAAVKGVMAAKYRNGGQTCISVNRVYVHSSVKTQFVEKLLTKVAKLKVGDGLSTKCHIGPLINETAVSKVKNLVDDAVNLGACIEYKDDTKTKDNFVSPVVLSGMNSSMRIAKEEIFGPVIAIFEFEEEEQVVRLANDTEYGLAAYFYTRDIGRVMKVSEALEYGMVGCNDTAISNAAAPFGGVKQSGMGREGSKYGLDDYLFVKQVCLGGLS